MQRSKAPITSWDDVRLLLTLTRARTVGEAATALAVDASTVSRKLAAMEKALGVSLFDRGRSGLTPTEAAEELVPVAEEIEAAIVRFGGAAEGLDRVATGVVRLACPPDVAEVFVVPILPALRARHPGLRLEIAPSEGLVDLSRREADLALRTVRPERGELVVTRLAMARWVLVASPKLARTLASPICAIVPAGFSADRADGTGAFRYEKRTGGCGLVKNPRAARGPAFLDEVVVSEAPDLASSLRSFEAGTDDLGWLGAGLHEPRAGSRPFDFGAAGYALLRTGKDASSWDAPGVAQRLADGIPPSRLAHLALGAPWAAQPDLGWGGAACDLLVRDDAPWLIELAKSVAAALTRPDHEVTVKPVPIRDIRDRRGTRAYTLMIDVARAFAPGTFGALAGLATADDPATAGDAIRHPPRVGEVPARTLTRSMRLGVLGDVRVQGARIPDLVLGPGASGFSFDWPSAYRSRR